MMADCSVVCVFLGLFLLSYLQPGCCEDHYQQIDLTSSSSGVTCSMDSIFNDSYFGTSLNCTGAINGNTSTTWTPTKDPIPNCIYTTNKAGEHYWQVNVGQTRNIHRITIYPEMGDPEYMRNITVVVNQTRIFTFPSVTENIQNPTVITDNLPLRGNVIKLTITGNYVTFCELQAEGCESGRHGPACQETCSAGCHPDTCDSITGDCTCNTGWTGSQCRDCSTGYYEKNGNCVRCGAGCQGGTCEDITGSCNCRPGWQQPLCQECISGRYGTDCDMNCSAGCQNTTCNKDNGTCSPCKTGWTGLKCDVCADGWYGDSCSERCSTGCSNTCDKQDGTCNCRTGWNGTKCDACASGYYSTSTTASSSSDCRKCGAGCETTSCEDVTGNCSCRPGWQSPTCQECVDGKFGDDCDKTCNAGCNNTCDDSGRCECRQGWEGDTCDACTTGYYNKSESGSQTCIPCGSGCNDTCDGQSGECACYAGWEPPYCDQECSAGSYGQDCRETCAPGCNGSCHVITGNCTCGPQWIQPGCTNCSAGHYSPNQGCKPCGTGCENVTSCDASNGLCPCKTGWEQPTCHECMPRFWGDNCSLTCENCGGAGYCKRQGECDTGCVEGWTGPACTQQLKSGEPNIAPVAGGVAGAVLAIAIVVVIIIVFRRRKMREGRNDSYGEVSDGGKDFYEGPSKTLSMETPRQSDSKPTGAVKPMKRADSSQKSTSAGHVYSNMSETDMNSGVDGNIPRPSDNNAAVSTSNTRNSPTSGTSNSSSTTNGRPASAAPRRDNVYENVTLPARSGQDSQPARPAQASRPPVGPKPVAHPAVTNKRSQGDDMPELDDDDAYNSEDLYGSFKSLSSTQQLDAFQRYLIACLGSGELADQFDKLPKGMTRPHKIGLSEENKRKNRFKAMCTYDFNRVILRRPKGDNSSDYINATYINGADREKQYIATQGPRVNTIDDLWWMVWQEGITQIVMLANLQEDGKDKCEQYWPASGKSQTCGHVTVRAFEEQERADYVIRSFLLKAKGSSGERQVTQYHYMAWPDHGVPLAASLVDYWRYVKGRTTSTVPLLVHCSAGVGRTGTFIALDIAYDQESRGRDVNVNEIVTKLREERCLMVQSEAQYKFLHEVILEAHTSRDTRIPMNQFDVRFPGTIRLNTDNAVIDKEFLMLKQMGQFAGKPKHTMATMPENLDKNRNMDALPDDDHLVYLSAYVRGRNQYINAVYMSSFQQQKGFVLTQLPIPDNTLVDFWRLVEGCGVSTVISIGSEEEEKTVTNFCQYWPQRAGEVLNIGPYKVTLTTSTALNEHVSSYKLAFKTPSEDRSREVELLHYRNWAGEVPGDTSSLLQLVDTVKAKQTDDVTTSAKGAKPDDIKSPVVVQCIDGAARSGLFCALYDVISRVTYDEEVDVYLTAREVQRIRPQAVATQTQYRYLYQALQEYIRHLDVYQNV